MFGDTQFRICVPLFVTCVHRNWYTQGPYRHSQTPYKVKLRLLAFTPANRSVQVKAMSKRVFVGVCAGWW